MAAAVPGGSPAGPGSIPGGIDGKSFFQKHAPHFTPEWVKTVAIHSESGDRDVEYFVVEDEEALVYMANSAAIPLHVWSSRVASLDRPDWTVLDLDPKQAPFGDVVRVAREIKELCDSIGLPCYAKTSGKTGMHVLVPLGRSVTYEHSRMLADLLALVVSRRYSEIATVNRSLHARADKVYIDAVQNGAALRAALRRGDGVHPASLARGQQQARHAPFHDQDGAGPAQAHEERADVVRAGRCPRSSRRAAGAVGDRASVNAPQARCGSPERCQAKNGVGRGTAPGGL